MTPLHYAAQYNRIDIANLLLRYGRANRLAVDTDGNLPLHLAVWSDNHEIAKDLLSTYVQDQLFAPDSDGSFPLHLAINNDCEFSVPLLLKVCYSELGGLETYKLIENPRKEDSNRPLHIACQTGSLRMVQLLVRDFRAKYDKVNKDNATPLYLACQYGHTDVAQYLIKINKMKRRSKEILEQTDNDGYTPLLIATSNGHSDTVAMLVREGADIEAQEREEKNVFYIAAEEKRSKVLATLYSLRPNSSKQLIKRSDQNGNTSLHVAAEKGHSKCLRMLVQFSKQVNMTNEDDQTPLHLAAMNGHFYTFSILIEADSNLMQEDDSEGNTPLHLAAGNGHAEAVSVLISQGARVDSKNTQNWTPLDCAAANGHEETCQVLIENDSPLNPTDALNQTPLHLACERGHEHVTKLLLDKGADISIKHRNGFNCLDFAVDNGKWDCAKTILDHENWKDAMRSKIQDPKSGAIMTPMRRLIIEMPDLALKVFTKCITQLPVSGPNDTQQYKFDFEFLDDAYAAALWDDGTKSKGKFDDSISVASGKTGISEPDSVVLYDFEGKLTDPSKSYDYCKNPDVVSENHPLILVVKEKNSELLEHPLTLALLSYKWKSYGRAFYFMNLAIYVIFLIFFNAFMLAVPAPYVMRTYHNQC